MDKKIFFVLLIAVVLALVLLMLTLPSLVRHEQHPTNATPLMGNTSLENNVVPLGGRSQQLRNTTTQGQIIRLNGTGELHTTANGTVRYTHPAGVGTAEQDCFDESGAVCLTRDMAGPIQSVGTAQVQWGCGPCSNVTRWYSSFDQDFKSGCVGERMTEIVGKQLCIKSPSGEWDIVFESFQGGGEGGELSYVRTPFKG